MVDDMGTFRTDVEIENSARPDVRRTIMGALVDMGAELSGSLDARHLIGV